MCFRNCGCGSDDVVDVNGCDRCGGAKGCCVVGDVGVLIPSIIGLEFSCI